MASMYGDGWRQGSIIEVDLPLDAIVLGNAGRPERASTDHGLWVVVTQDCDLDRAERDARVPVVEVRPVFTEGCPSDWGVRSARLRLTEDEYVETTSPRATVAPNVLTAALDAGASRRDGGFARRDVGFARRDVGFARRDVGFARRQGLKTWLGLRYDRPAVPDHLVSLAQRIGKEVARPRHRTIDARVRDVLMQFDDTANPVRYSLFAVLDDPADEEEVRAWLAQVSHAVPADLGVADQIEAADASGIAFSTIESSYAADVSLVTWRRDQPDPEGAT